MSIADCFVQLVWALLLISGCSASVKVDQVSSPVAPEVSPLSPIATYLGGRSVDVLTHSGLLDSETSTWLSSLLGNVGCSTVGRAPVLFIVNNSDLATLCANTSDPDCTQVTQAAENCGVLNGNRVVCSEDALNFIVRTAAEISVNRLVSCSRDDKFVSFFPDGQAYSEPGVSFFDYLRRARNAFLELPEIERQLAEDYGRFYRGDLLDARSEECAKPKPDARCQEPLELCLDEIDATRFRSEFVAAFQHITSFVLLHERGHLEHCDVGNLHSSEDSPCIDVTMNMPPRIARKRFRDLRASIVHNYCITPLGAESSADEFAVAHMVSDPNLVKDLSRYISNLQVIGGLCYPPSVNALYLRSETSDDAPVIHSDFLNAGLVHLWALGEAFSAAMGLRGGSHPSLPRRLLMVADKFGAQDPVDDESELAKWRKRAIEQERQCKEIATLSAAPLCCSCSTGNRVCAPMSGDECGPDSKEATIMQCCRCSPNGIECMDEVDCMSAHIVYGYMGDMMTDPHGPSGTDKAPEER